MPKPTRSLVEYRQEMKREASKFHNHKNRIRLVELIESCAVEYGDSQCDEVIKQCGLHKLDWHLYVEVS